MNSLRIRGRELLHSASRFLGLTIYPFSGILAAGPSSAWGTIAMGLTVTFTKCYGGHRCRSCEINDLCAVVIDRSRPCSFNFIVRPCATWFTRDHSVKRVGISLGWYSNPAPPPLAFESRYHLLKHLSTRETIR
jgi:hypothetical protein